MAQPASLSLTLKDSDGQVVLYAEGEIDIATTPVFSSALESLSGESGDLVIDLAGVTFIDSSGLHALAGVARDLASSERKVVIQNPHKAVHRALEVSGLLSKFVIHN